MIPPRVDWRALADEAQRDLRTIRRWRRELDTNPTWRPGERLALRRQRERLSDVARRLGVPT